MFMKKKLKALAIGMSLTCFLTACSSAGKSSSSSDVGASKDSAASSTSSQATMEPTTINIRIMNAFTNLDKILEVYYDKVKDDPILSKITLNFSYVTGADYIDKLSLAISAQEDYDLMFCGSWQGLESVNTKNCIYNHSEINETTEHNIKFIITRKNSSKTF